MVTIHEAARSGDLAVVVGLIQGNASLATAKNANGSTPLMCAAFKGHCPVIAHLIDVCGVSVHDQNIDLKVALILAALTNNEAAVTLLLDRGANPNREDKTSNAALTYAAMAGHTSVVRLLAGHAFTDLEVLGRHGQSYRAPALGLSVKCSRWGAARALLQAGADPDAATAALIDKGAAGPAREQFKAAHDVAKRIRPVQRARALSEIGRAIHKGYTDARHKGDTEKEVKRKMIVDAPPCVRRRVEQRQPLPVAAFVPSTCPWDEVNVELVAVTRLVCGEEEVGLHLSDDMYNALFEMMAP